MSYNISLSQIKSMESGQDQLLKMEIKAKREKLREGIRTLCFNKKVPKPLTVLCDQSGNLESPTRAKTRKRRHSCYQNCSFMNSLKDVTINETFQDCYEIQQPIGAGAHAIVYRCREIASGEVWAVKVRKRGDQQMIQRIKQYYRVLKSLRHPGIIEGKYLYVNEKRQTTHLVLQYSKFPELRKFITKRYKKGKGIQEFEAAEILQTLIGIVVYLHQKGCCHRDLKPENILYDELSGKMKIVDFEIAKMPKYEEQKLQMLTDTGTLFYRAPESFLGGLYNEMVDVWALGVIAYEMITGKLPFVSLQKHEAVKLICQREPIIEQLEISNSAKGLLRKLLQKNPEVRLSAKEALNLPFIMKNSTNSSRSLSPRHSLINNGFQEDDLQSKKDNRQRKGSLRYYDQSSRYSFLGTISEDIGIRVYQTDDDY